VNSCPGGARATYGFAVTRQLRISLDEIDKHKATFGGLSDQIRAGYNATGAVRISGDEVETWGQNSVSVRRSPDLE